MLKECIGRKLKQTRLHFGMTIEDLAASSGVSSNMISRLERGLTTPSVEILLRLARAFGLSVSYFVEEVQHGSNVVVSRRGQGTPLFFFEDKHQIVGLSQGLRDASFGAFMEIIEPGCSSGEGLMVHSGEEFALVLDGALDLVIEEQQYQLQQGDSIAFKASLPHRWANAAAEQTRVVWVMSQPPQVAMAPEAEAPGADAAKAPLQGDAP